MWLVRMQRRFSATVSFCVFNALFVMDRCFHAGFRLKSLASFFPSSRRCLRVGTSIGSIRASSAVLPQRQRVERGRQLLQRVPIGGHVHVPLQDVLPGVSDPLPGGHRHGPGPQVHVRGLPVPCGGRQQCELLGQNGFTYGQPSAIPHQ